MTSAPIGSNRSNRSNEIAVGVELPPWDLSVTATVIVAGAIEIGTFFVPAPGDYDPLLDPPVVWQ